MNTTMALLSITTALLFGCSAADEHTAQTEPSPPAHAAASNKEPTNAPAPCPAASGTPITPPTPALAASPTTKCQGYYSASLYGNQWLHRTAKGCVIGTGSFVLHDDGTADLSSEGPGRFEGDEFYFTMIPNDPSQQSISWTRLPAEPSK